MHGSESWVGHRPRESPVCNSGPAAIVTDAVIPMIERHAPDPIPFVEAFHLIATMEAGLAGRVVERASPPPELGNPCSAATRNVQKQAEPTSTKNSVTKKRNTGKVDKRGLKQDLPCCLHTAEAPGSTPGPPTGPKQLNGPSKLQVFRPQVDVRGSLPHHVAHRV